MDTHDNSLIYLKPVCFISAGSWSTPAHFVVDAPSTGIVRLETLTATVGWNMNSHNMYIGISPTEPCIIDRVARTQYLAADSQLVKVNVPTFVAKGISIFELTKLKSVTAANDVRNVLKVDRLQSTTARNAQLDTSHKKLGQFPICISV